MKTEIKNQKLKIMPKLFPKINLAKFTRCESLSFLFPQKKLKNMSKYRSINKIFSCFFHAVDYCSKMWSETMVKVVGYYGKLRFSHILTYINLMDWNYN